MIEEDTLYPETGAVGASPNDAERHYLIVMSGPLLGKKYTLDLARIRLGRDLFLEICIPDKTVSRQHAEIWKSHGKRIIRDLSSQNGLFVNNLKIEEWLLRDGDLIRLGETLLQFVDAESRRSFYAGAYRHNVAIPRAHPRFSLIAIGDGYLPEEKIKVEILSIKDISRAGIGLLTKTKLNPGAVMKVSIYFKNRDNQVVSEDRVGSVLCCNSWRKEVYMINVRFHEPINETNSPGLDFRLRELEQLS